jgi:hypothetical protein
MTSHRDQSNSPAAWRCTIGEVDRAKLPAGADLPMRLAVARAYRELTGEPVGFIFSGWDAELTEAERAVVEDREPDPDA